MTSAVGFVATDCLDQLPAAECSVLLVRRRIPGLDCGAIFAAAKVHKQVKDIYVVMLPIAL